jgi:hypothetical protein
MAYVLKRRVFRDFRHEFPQLCAASSVPAPLDFSVLKNIEEVVEKPVEGLPPGWINVRTYMAERRRPNQEEPEPDAHKMMYKCVRKLRTRWEKWNREHDVFVDYDHYDDGLVDDEIDDDESESSYAEDPEDEWSD